MTPEELEQIAEEERTAQAQVPHRINVCVAAGCISCQSSSVKEAIDKEIVSRGWEKKCKSKGVGCMGLCAEGPLVSTETGTLYQHVAPADAGEILDSLEASPVDRLVCRTDVPFFQRQKKIVLENSGVVDPERVEEYVGASGYGALINVLTEMAPSDVVQEVVKSGLRGRGGAGYPTGLKWSTVAKAAGQQKYVICNADEGDPGAFMDRSVLESDPHRVLEGMLIAAYAVGASEGYIYVRAEYPLAIKRLRTAIRQAERIGLLGSNICGTRFSFRIDLRLGAGAFVCGEETALIASVEGRRGTPRPRPPYPAQEGLFGCPTLINNVETYANIAPIIRNGGEWYSQIGTEKSKGTKVFALAGSVLNTGLVEVPMGITLREIVFDIGGGIPGGRAFKAVQTGGPSGGCLPSQFLDMPVDYESLAKAGSIMGSGGMIVMDESSCMVDVAKYFMDFCMTESCGKCVPCRVGTYQMNELLARITGRTATTQEVTLLEELCDLLRNTSLVRARTVRSQSGGEHVALLRRRVQSTRGTKDLPRRSLRTRREGSFMNPGTNIKTLKIDGKDFSARQDETILAVARQNKIFIPTLCDLRGLSTVGACRLCLVEIKGSNKLLPACVTRVEEGMEVTTTSERLDRYRRSILELLFTERNHICSVCVSNGHCELQTLAQRLQITHVHFPYRYPKVQVDGSHDRFIVDHNRCILCTRCVRVCEEIEGAHTWDVMGRGIDAKVITDLNQPWGSSETCTGCGKCVHVCPTGALFEKGRSVAEMLKRRQFLPYLTLMREERE